METEKIEKKQYKYRHIYSQIYTYIYIVFRADTYTGKDHSCLPGSKVNTWRKTLLSRGAGVKWVLVIVSSPAVGHS